MYLFFEEDGAFKAGTVLSQTDKTYQVELPTGRRTKIKAGHVFFSFEAPKPAEMLEAAQSAAATLDPDFLWEVAPEGEFGAADLAADYWGEGAGAVERASFIFALHANPAYFHRKGRGVYRRAPAEILRQAKEALERKRKLEELKKSLCDAMLAGELPDAIARQAMNLMLRPDKNSVEWKAMNDAASAARLTPLRLLLKLGAFASPWTWHVESFYAANFPKGRGFDASLPAPDEALADDLPVANVRAFSIDDSSTTEIDDAISVTKLADGRTSVGIHIAAPALGIEAGGALDAVATERMSTVYAPGLKTTMLPENWIAAYSLDEGRTVPCLSLYVTVASDYAIEKTETRLERIAVAANLRHDVIESAVSEEAVESGKVDMPFGEEIVWLWRFAQKLVKRREERRGRPEGPKRTDWFFVLEGEGENAKIAVRGRRRGEPLDLIVAELMILANETWGLWLEEHGVSGVYRSQRMGRVRMSTTPGPHDGLGVVRYAWSTSPLRRYVDLVNQRQMLATLRGLEPAYGRKDSTLFEIVTRFEEVYATYADFQAKMERYWSLRWILQEGLKEIEAIVVKGDLVRIEGLPFLQRVPGLPEDLERGRKVRLQILGCDLVDLVMDTRILRILEETEDEVEDEDELFAEAQDATEQSAEEAASESSEDKQTSS